ncbi:MAG: hypothetical protein GY771_01495 [bacterium]|nr:hypothetical protein [bacterium]
MRKYFIILFVLPLLLAFYGCCCGGLGEFAEGIGDIAGGDVETFNTSGLTFDTPRGFAAISSPAINNGIDAPAFDMFFANEDGIVIRVRRDEMPMPGTSDSGTTVDMTTQTNLEVYARTYAANATGGMNTGVIINGMDEQLLANANATAGCYSSFPLSETQKEIQGADLEYIIFLSRAPNKVYLVSMIYGTSEAISATLAIATLQASVKVVE